MPSRETSGAGAESGLQRRRPRGEPRRLILAAARDLFNQRGYSDTSTREVADTAGVSETLIFRYFINKVGLFHAAMVKPFVEVIDGWIEGHPTVPGRAELSRKDTKAFVAQMYDVFHAHRGLAALVFAEGALAEAEVAESGAVEDVRAAIDRLVSYTRGEARLGGAILDARAHDLAIRGHLAMVAGVATFGQWYFGARRPSREKIINELSEWVWLRFAAQRKG